MSKNLYFKDIFLPLSVIYAAYIFSSFPSNFMCVIFLNFSF